MGVVIPQLAPASLDRVSGAQVIDGSLKFDYSKTTNLSRTPGSEGNRKTWTWSGWFNRQNVGANDNIFKVAGSSDKATQFTIMIHNGNYVSIDYGGAFYLKTNRLLRDTSGWYNFVVTVDTTLSTADNRIRLYINGVEETSFATRNNPNQSEDLGVNRTSAHTISTGDSSGFDGLFSNFYLIDGAALGPENFGFTDPLTNTWKPKKYNHRTDLYGVTWSSALVGDASGFPSPATAASGFNGEVGTDDGDYAQNSTGTNPSTITFTPVGGIKFNSSIQVYLINAANTVNVNGEGAQSIAANEWVTVKTGSGTLNTLVFSRPSTNGASFAGIRIDGHILIDAQNDNSFYLPFDGNSPIGQDQSGNGNNYTPVNFGGSVELDNPQVSGARPILNTTQGASQAGVGVFGSKQNVGYAVTYYDDGGGNKYYIDGVKQATLTGLIRGATYTFNTVSLGSTHPFRLSATSAHGTEYTNGVAAITGAATTITIPYDAPESLYYYCTAHSGMGSSITGITTNEKLADQYASNIVFAAPLVGSNRDVSASIACTATTHAVTTSGATSSGGIGNFYNGSVKFDGTNDYVTWGSAADWKFLSDGTSDYTLECWIRGTSTYGYLGRGYIMFNTSGAIGSGESGVGFWFNSSALNFHVSPNATIQTVINHTYTLPPDKWVHCALVKEGNEIRAYIDGIKVATNASYSTWTSNNPTAGALNTGRTTDGYYYNDGYMQDMRIYNIAKYTSNFVPASTNPDILSDTPSGVSGGSKLTKITDGAVSFDGGDNTYLSIADSTDFDHASSFTWEGYFYLNSYDSSGSSILRHENDGVDWYINTSGNIVFNQNPSTTIVNTGNNVMILNKWVHIAVSHTGSVCKIYVDGIEKASATTSTVPDNVSGILYIGETGDTNTYQWNGFISNLRFVNGTALYTSNFTPPIAPLTNVTNTKLLCCQSNVFPGGAAVSPNISGLNNGTQWSSYLTTTQGANSRDFYSVASYPASNLFDGDTSTIVYGGWTDDDDDASDLIFSPPGGVAVSSKLEVYVGYYSKIKVNGSDYNTGGQSTAQAWVTVSDGSNFTGTLTELILENTSNANVVRAAAIRIDDSTILLDPVAARGNAAATNFNPFSTDINTVRGQETGYATLNPLYQNPNGNTTSDGNLTQTTTAGNGHYRANFNIGASSGKFYFEYTPTAGAVSGMVGLCEENHGAGSNLNGTTAYSYYGVTGNKQGGPSAVDAAYGATYTYGDVIGVAFDSDNNTLEYFKNGISEGVAFTSFPNYPYYPAFSAGSSSNTVTYNVNFGQKPFKFPPPDGFQPLNAANTRPVKVIARPDQFVGLTTYTGSVSPQTVGGINFTSDFIWIKSRTHTAWNILQDSVRGFGKILFANDANAEVGNANDLISNVSSTGFSVNTTYAGGTDTATTTTSGTNSYVGWCWKAGGNKNTFNVDDVGYASASDVGMNVGGQNSNAYNTSQIWSSTYAGSAIDGSYPITQAFDGNRSTAARVSATETVMSVALTNITVTDKIEVFGELGFNTPNVSVTVGGVTHNIGGDPSSAVSGTSGTTTKTITGVSGALTNVTVGKVSSGRSYLSQIVVDGKILVNSNITPPNAPSIAATGCSVGTKQGFSIIKYQGNGTSGATVPHGLNEPVDLILFKSLGRSDNWRVYHSGVGLEKALFLSTTGAADDNAVYFNDTAPTSSVFSLGTDSGVNTNSDNVIAYCWHNVAGLQKFGSYIGNANADGPFIELGFRPSVIIIKRSDGGTENWTLWDAARNPHNVMGKQLYPNLASAEADAGTNSAYGILDFVSNGVKIRGSHTSFNSSGHTFIYAAWAEAPTIDLYGGGSNAR